MTARIICAVPLLGLLFTLQAAAKEATEKLSFSYDGKVRTYYCYIPNDQGNLPLVVLLHGSGRNGRVMIDAWKELASKQHFIIVAPDSYTSEGWLLTTDGPYFIHDLIEQVKTKHPVDSGRTYLFGHSAGAEYALMLALLESEYFAATAIHAGAMRSQNSHLFDYAKRKMPIAIWVGDRDAFFPVSVVNTTKEMFRTKGFDVEISIIPNHDHNYYRISYEVNKRAWDFLKKTELKEPNFQEYQLEK